MRPNGIRPRLYCGHCEMQKCHCHDSVCVCALPASTSHRWSVTYLVRDNNVRLNINTETDNLFAPLRGDSDIENNLARETSQFSRDRSTHRCHRADEFLFTSESVLFDLQVIHRSNWWFQMVRTQFVECRRTHMLNNIHNKHTRSNGSVDERIANCKLWIAIVCRLPRAHPVHRAHTHYIIAI